MPFTGLMAIRQRKNRICKRTLDLVLSVLFLCSLFPFLYLIIGLAIKLTSRGPILFRQQRTGLYGKEFCCYKFRTMYLNEYSDTKAAADNDLRITPVGRFLRDSGLDELPQFLNVFLGDMSIVGPRPHMLYHTEEYSKLIDNYMLRHSVLPGITGWAQMQGCQGTIHTLQQLQERVSCDLWYIEHWSFGLDLRIILHTAKTILHRVITK